MFANRTALLFILTTFTTGLGGSFFFPLASVFLVEALGASPYMLSAYMMMSVASTVVVSQFIAHNSDKHWHRKTILVVAFTCYLVTVVSFSVVQNYWYAVGVTMVFGSVSGAIFGQLFALGREFADRELEDKSTSFLSSMRAGMAVAWVFGPPIAFILKGAYGFSTTFLTAGVITTVTLAVVYFLLPDGTVEENKNIEEQKTHVRWYTNVAILTFSFALLMLFSANNIYVTSMPLILTQELSYQASLPGLLFGIAALFEIPIMLSAGKLSKRFNTNALLLLAAFFGALFYFGMLHAQSIWQMALLQVFNGIFVGLIATLGMVALQDKMKHQLGVASTLFTNIMQISVLVSSLAIGIVGSKHGYLSLMYVSMLGAAIASALLIGFWLKESNRNQQPIISEE